MDYLSILILNFFINPILAFTIYFCFLHSIRHSLSLIFELDNNFNKGLNKFVKKSHSFNSFDSNNIFAFIVLFKQILPSGSGDL